MSCLFDAADGSIRVGPAVLGDGPHAMSSEDGRRHADAGQRRQPHHRFLLEQRPVACLDRDGNLLWYRGLTYEYPKASNSLGMSSSPVIARRHGDRTGRIRR